MPRTEAQAMVSNLFLAFTLLGSEWVLAILIVLSIASIAMTFERVQFYKKASIGLDAFRKAVRELVSVGRYPEALALADERRSKADAKFSDLETEMIQVLLKRAKKNGGDIGAPEALEQLGEDAVIRARVPWEHYLSVLASIGSNTPFFGLFGTVLGIIKAFHDLSASSSGAQSVSAGISEALVATAVGLFVAIPAVIAYNTFQKRVKTAVQHAEALKNFIIGNLTG